ncbi:unnamed protein product [Enterobius vermicularis]|uniref:Transposase n=1 Tax=Enterobius vermicularis TaxID=51028 RepID=A0A0N4V8B1_ENTVE|nr:unnamed protein product [Enterobius vermicularis]
MGKIDPSFWMFPGHFLIRVRRSAASSNVTKPGEWKAPYWLRQMCNNGWIKAGFWKVMANQSDPRVESNGDVLKVENGAGNSKNHSEDTFGISWQYSS